MRKNLLALAAGECLARAFLMGAAIVVSRVLGPVNFGAYSLGLAAIGLFIVVTDVGLTTFMLREIVRRPGDRDALVSTATAVQAVVAALLAVAVIGTSYQASFPAEGGRVLRAFCPLLVLQALNLSYVAQAAERMAIVSVVKVVREGVAGAFAVALVLWTADAAWVASASWVGLVTSDILLAGCLRRRGLIRWERPDPSLVRAVVLGGAPFLLSAVLVQVLISADVVVLGLLRGEAVVGAYAAAFRLSAVASMAAGLVLTVAFPQLVARHAARAGDFGTLVTDLLRIPLLVVLPGALVVITFADEVVALVFGSKYAAAAAPLRVVFLLPSLAWMNTFAGGALVAAGQVMRNLAVTAAAAAVALLSLFALIPRYGAAGAGAAGVVAEGCTLALYVWSVRRKLELDWGVKLLDALPAAVVLAVVLSIRALLGERSALALALGVTVYVASLAVTFTVVRQFRAAARPQLPLGQRSTRADGDHGTAD